MTIGMTRAVVTAQLGYGQGCFPSKSHNDFRKHTMLNFVEKQPHLEPHVYTAFEIGFFLGNMVNNSGAGELPTTLVMFCSRKFHNFMDGMIRLMLTEFQEVNFNK